MENILDFSTPQFKTELIYSVVRDVKYPVRGTEKSAGLDLHVPNFNQWFVLKFKELNLLNKSKIIYKKRFQLFGKSNSTPYISVPKFSHVIIPLGVHFNIPQNHILRLIDKSGFSTKNPFKVTAGIIDQDYQGEILLALFNFSNKTQTISQDTKIVQAILMPVTIPTLTFCDFDNLYLEISERGDKGFGSTDKK